LVLTLLHASIGDLVGGKVILKYDLIDLSYSFSRELVGSHVDLHNVLVAFEGVLQGGCVALLDLVAAHVQTLNVLVGLEELS
jgi:hypothetical protein